MKFRESEITIQSKVAIMGKTSTMFSAKKDIVAEANLPDHPQVTKILTELGFKIIAQRNQKKRRSLFNAKALLKEFC